MSKPKKLNNRFDQWEILSVFCESAEDYLQENYSWRSTNFIFKTILGVLLAVNAYLSHWGWPWPQSYNYIFFSIFFYHGASFIFERINTIKPNDGKMVFLSLCEIGEYIVDGRQRTYHMRLTPERQDYILEEIDGVTKEVLRRKAFVYYEYFTEDGKLLEKEFQQHFRAFLKSK